ncbi:channel protein (hemolysin III family) [Loktanella sp. PT4BL]|jgi:hemolysin III|uniref:PAQR family membrane homeostasis protein TrhA n=1 Tax=Loktanella sp. PT4BL TaxID=2135611 RepID=UPI000D76C28E|nr:hemolysin III family protein [Loktanella sp. PT4BL]PXW72785.1 channel protein (hemolysin III family) [Loktanella sp. PT4BL]
MYPTYARSERIADGTMHAVGVLGAITGAIVLIIWSLGTATPGQIAAICVYGATLIATFVASAFYHMTPWEGIRPLLRRFDHAAIYLKIAGTYTPLVVMIGSGFAYAVLAIVWGLAVIGMTLKLFFWQTPGRFGPALYLIMGWLSLALVWSLWPVVPVAAMVLIAVGGLLYTAGVPFYASETLKFSIAIWHGFVVAASACFFAAIAIATAALT